MLYLYKKSISSNMTIKEINNLKKIASLMLSNALSLILKDINKNLDNKNFIVELFFINDEYMKKINFKYRNINATTNVLSLQLIGKDELKKNISFVELSLGSIFISTDTLVKESKEQNVLIENYFIKLAIHGLLHLFGYDHQNDKEALQMENMEEKILNFLQINEKSIVSNYWN